MYLRFYSIISVLFVGPLVVSEIDYDTSTKTLTNSAELLKAARAIVKEFLRAANCLIEEFPRS
jgi:hypothetical protein